MVVDTKRNKFESIGKQAAQRWNVATESDTHFLHGLRSIVDNLHATARRNNILPKRGRLSISDYPTSYPRKRYRLPSSLYGGNESSTKYIICMYIYVYIYFIVDNCVGGAQPRPDAIGPSRRGPAVIKSCTDYRIKAFVKNTVNIHRINLCKTWIQIRSTRAERLMRRIDRCEVRDRNLPFPRPRINESRFTLETNRNDDGDYFNSEGRRNVELLIRWVLIFFVKFLYDSLDFHEFST